MSNLDYNGLFFFKIPRISAHLNLTLSHLVMIFALQNVTWCQSQAWINERVLRKHKALPVSSMTSCRYWVFRWNIISLCCKILCDTVVPVPSLRRVPSKTDFLGVPVPSLDNRVWCRL